ncbi:diacylglycerol kinase family protein [Deinococcus sp. YIM 77859]|uniref:diacylglycerol/lipid kinase family protein n=1 Tax=Deinococcus sp. YIM 77859 TaxID=1540221 RepID=UPI000A41C6BF|nr:diacylglycerol kinase family protein [Deinococcus sp. YIM 77859]
MSDAPSFLSSPSCARYAAVLNPNAGRGLAARVWPRLEAELYARGLSFEPITEPSGSAALARVGALPPDVGILAVGGDGTVGALLPALVGTGRALGIVPLGSGNDFAGMLGLRAGDFRAALSRLAGPPQRVDALRATILAGEGAGTSRLLINGLGLGFDAQVAALMNRTPAALPGFGRYVWAALGALRDLRLTSVAVEVDGEELYVGPSALTAVMNGTRYGGGFHISPASDPRDGRLNVLASGPLTRRQLLALMGRVLPGRHLGHPQVYHRAGRVVTVRWAQPMALHLDGDPAGQVTALQVEVLPGAVTLLNGTGGPQPPHEP